MRSAGLLWTGSQRGVLVGLLAVFWGYLVYRYFTNPQFVSDPQPPEAIRAADLEDRIDPNRAEWQMLASLPLIGERRARDIVSYREQYIVEHPGQVAFAGLTDLTNIRGIGTATIAQLEPYLIFPGSTTMPATAPAAN